MAKKKIILEDIHDEPGEYVERTSGGDKNCLSFWFPKLEAAGLPVPKTIIIRHPQDEKSDLIHLLDGKMPEKFDDLARKISEAAIELGLPAFLRTGQTSGKHEWRRTCCLPVASIKTVKAHIGALVNFSAIVDLMGLANDVWVVREWLKGPIAFYADQFDAMPVRREFRCFVDGPEVVCVHPYWPRRALDTEYHKLSEDDANLLALISNPDRDLDEITSLASKAGEALVGQWSVDVLDTDRGWFITDCALAHRSFHWDGCEQFKRFIG